MQGETIERQIVKACIVKQKLGFQETEMYGI
jgi:hypothetical protein